MLILGIGLLFAGYSVSSYGYVLVKGWDITLREWFSPLNPYQWPAKGTDPPSVPQGQVWPSGTQPANAGPVTQKLGRAGGGTPSPPGRTGPPVGTTTKPGGPKQGPRS